MNNKDKNGEKIIKKLSQIFKGMKERMKNPKSNIEQIAELFKDSLYQAYVINDINLNNKAIMAYREVLKVLELRLEKCKNSDERYQINKFLFELEGIMDKFSKQACKLYD